jgi:hypothetical protein
MAKLKRTLGENIPVELVFRDNESRRPAPQLFVTAVVTPVAAFPVPTTKHPRRPPSAAPFSGTSPNVYLNDDPVKVKARDWSGEWNLSDIRQVQNGLRALRT